MQPQQPPHSASPPWPTKRTIALVTFLSLLVLGLTLIAIPMVRRANQAANAVTSNGHLKNIGTFLFLFGNDYSTFPSNETARLFRAKGIPISPNESSNAYFSQLVLTGYTDSEEIFSAPGTYSAYDKGPDSVINPPSEALKPGEVGFAYLTRENGVPFSPRDPGAIPIVIDAYKPGTSRFDPDLRAGRIVYLRIDQSAQNANLDSQGRIPLHITKKTQTFLFDPKNPTWEKGLPVLHQPLPASP